MLCLTYAYDQRRRVNMDLGFHCQDSRREICNVVFTLRYNLSKGLILNDVNSTFNHYTAEGQVFRTSLMEYHANTPLEVILYYHVSYA